MHHDRRRRPARTLRPLALAVLLAVTALASANGEAWSTAAGRERVFQAVVDLFRDRYWNPDRLDWNAWAQRYRDQALSATSRRAFDGAMRRMVADVRDDHSTWLGLTDAPASAGGPQPGLGVLTTYVRGEGLVVDRVLPTSPAESGGLRRGDVIERVVDASGAAHDLRGAAAADAGELQAAAATGGDVNLEVRRVRHRFQLRVTPAVLPFDQLEREPTAQMLDGDTGYLYLPSFTAADTGKRVHALLHDLQARGATSLVLDLRGNRGGSLSQLGLVLGAFVRGPWSQAVSRGHVLWRATFEIKGNEGVSSLVRADGSSAGVAKVESPATFDGALVVLVDRRNSSAGEIAALVLDHLGRATVVGEPTYGNVEAVRGFDLPDGSMVMVAVANVEAADGASFDAGVQPEIRASVSSAGLARGFDAPLAAARAVLQGLPFEPGRIF